MSKTSEIQRAKKVAYYRLFAASHEKFPATMPKIMTIFLLAKYPCEILFDHFFVSARGVFFPIKKSAEADFYNVSEGCGPYL
ncbi:hypothetical protein HMPREF3224_02229, partial [Anaerococcus hydrogenalis]